MRFEDKIEDIGEFLKTEALPKVIAGIVVKHSEIWKVNTNKVYNYDENCSEFINLDDLIE